ncbi:hypothetical protein [Paenibacillus sp. HB172176]|uniref:hypothetical protein n=1 Tax=Paenibacillus sp. HB172176 TaxID=2493690 RepID=UPI00143A3BE1|nr:hypothetical protein [Paenibacillus sp. HB172176]
MNNKIKDEMASIPIPSALHSRSLKGIHEAQAVRVSRRKDWSKTIAAAAIVATLVFGALFHGEVYAAIQKSLQFIPGIGVVKEETAPEERWILKEPVRVEIGDGYVDITGLMSDEKETYMTVSAFDLPRFESVTFINEAGDSFTVSRSMYVGTLNEWTGDFWHNGALPLAGKISFYFDDYREAITSISLAKAESYAGYDELGQTVKKNGAAITLIPNHGADRMWVNIVSRLDDDGHVIKYGYLDYAHRDSGIQLTNKEGNPVAFEWQQATGAPNRVFSFASHDEGPYVLTLPAITVSEKDKTKLTLTIPPIGETSSMTQSFELADFKVDMTKLERVDATTLKVYVDTHYKESDPRSIMQFRLDRSSMLKTNERTGEMEFFQFEIEPGSKKVTVELSDPAFLVRGPWTFTLN